MGGSREGWEESTAQHSVNLISLHKVQWFVCGELGPFYLQCCLAKADLPCKIKLEQGKVLKTKCQMPNTLGILLNEGKMAGLCIPPTL